MLFPGEIGLCDHHRTLNYKILSDPGSNIANILDFQNNLYGINVFSTLDFTRAYCQIPINPANISKTAIIITFLQ